MEMKVFLRQHRKNANLSQRQVANILGYSTPQFISNWERGVSTPPVSVLKILSKIYGFRMESVYHVAIQQKVFQICSEYAKEYLGREESPLTIEKKSRLLISKASVKKD